MEGGVVIIEIACLIVGALMTLLCMPRWVLTGELS